MGTSWGGITPLVRKHYRVLPSVSRRYPRPQGSFPCCPLPSAAFLYCYILARLACLIHAANVHSEPGSNPSLVYAQITTSHPVAIVSNLSYGFETGRCFAVNKTPFNSTSQNFSIATHLSKEIAARRLVHRIVKDQFNSTFYLV